MFLLEIFKRKVSAVEVLCFPNDRFPSEPLGSTAGNARTTSCNLMPMELFSEAVALYLH